MSRQLAPVVVTVVTENYLSRAKPFLKSLGVLWGVDRVCVCLGFLPSLAVRQDYPHVQFRSMPLHWSTDNGISQHGRFLDALPNVQDDRLYLLSDADILVQRDFTEAELRHFAGYDAETFGAAWNAGEGDNLLEEARRISMSFSPHEETLFPLPYSDIPCFNTGVLLMRGRAWKRLRDLYESRVERFWKLASYRTRTQWLVNWCLYRLGMKVDILPGSLHSHGHLGVPSGANIRDGFLYCGDDLVLFRHAI